MDKAVFSGMCGSHGGIEIDLEHGLYDDSAHRAARYAARGGQHDYSVTLSCEANQDHTWLAVSKGNDSRSNFKFLKNLMWENGEGIVVVHLQSTTGGSRIYFNCNRNSKSSKHWNSDISKNHRFPHLVGLILGDKTWSHTGKPFAKKRI